MVEVIYLNVGKTKLSLLGHLPYGAIFQHPGSGKYYIKTNSLRSNFGLHTINLETGVENDVFQSDTRVLELKGNYLVMN